MIYKVKTERDAISFSLAENVTFGVSEHDGCLYVGTPEALKRAGVIYTAYEDDKEELSREEEIKIAERAADKTAENVVNVVCDFHRSISILSEASDKAKVASDYNDPADAVADYAEVAQKACTVYSKAMVVLEAASALVAAEENIEKIKARIVK